MSYEQPTPLKKFLQLRMPSTFFTLLTSWWLFTMIVNVSFKCRLTAYMVYTPEPPTTLKELLNEGYNIVIDKSKLSSYLSIFEKEERSLILR